MKIFVKSKILYIILFIIIIFSFVFIKYFNTYENNTKIAIIPKETKTIDIYNDDIKESLNNIVNLYKEKKLLVLTFDDGPGLYTKKLVDEMKKRNIPLTFFILGQNVIGKETL